MWAVNSAAGVFLLVLLAVRKNYRFYPAFTFYIFTNLVLGALVFFIYGRWGFTSQASWYFAWGMQALVICARAVAVAELCSHLLSRFPGIWALAQRVLVGCAALVFLYSGLAARHQLESALPSADRGMELSIATVIVILFLFARYYDVEIEPADRTLAIGFCVYSCFFALNDTVLERYLYDYATLWSLLGVLAYFASLSLWSWALWETRTATDPKENLLSPGVYQSITPQINRQLRDMDDQLSKIWRPGVTRH
jgi:hypothetical protein